MSLYMSFEDYNFDQIDKNMYLLVLNSSKILIHALTICNQESFKKNNY